MVSFFKSTERSEYSYIGLADFFSGRNPKVCSRSFLIFRGLIFRGVISFQIQLISIVKRKACSTIEQQKCKVHE